MVKQHAHGSCCGPFDWGRLALAVVALSLVGTPPAWGQVEDPATGHVYQIIPDLVDWPTAAHAAAATTIHDLECHLATIGSQEEQDFLVNSLPETCRPASWLGGQQDPTGAEPDGGWGWITGEPWMFTSWDLGEPNDSGGEDCLEFSTPGRQYSWNDVPCDALRCYAIECEPRMVPTTPAWALTALALGLFAAALYFLERRRRRGI